MKKTILCLVLILICTSCEKKTTQKTTVPTVELGEAISQSIPYVIRTIGNTKAYQSVDIQPQVSGELTGYYFADGGDVEAGNLLFTIDPRTYEAELEQAKGQFIQAKSQLVYNEDKLNRYEKLLPDEFVSQLNFDEYVSNTKTSVGQVIEYKGAVDKAKVNVDYCTITAPFNGRCGRHLIDPGNIVDEKSVLLTINMITPIYAMISVPEKYFHEIRKYNSHSKEGLKVNISVIGNEQVKHSGHLDFINNTIDKNSGTLTVRGVFGNEDKSLWPGQFLHAEIELYEIPNAVLVPEQAVGLDTKGHFVWIADPKTQTVNNQRVTIGQNFDGRQVILKGVKSGNKVVTKGQLSLKPGSKYQVKG